MRSLLFRSLIAPFYKENLNLFFFLATVLVFSVGEVDGAELFQFHYSLAQGMLQNSGFQLFVFLCWLLYARKWVGFVLGRMQQPQYGFLSIYNCLDRPKRLGLFLTVAAWLMMPVLLYFLYLIVIGSLLHLYAPLLLTAAYLAAICLGAAIWLVSRLRYRHESMGVRVGLPFRMGAAYPIVLLRYVFHRQKWIWLGLKVFTCGLLYFAGLNNTGGYYETTTLFLFFNFGILGNGLIVHGVREFEETQLQAYRGAPVSLIKRLLQYALVYLVLLSPEAITAYRLGPEHLHYGDGVLFLLCGYSLVLVMHTISYLQHFTRREYLTLLLMIFSVQYFFMGWLGLWPMFGVLLAAAGIAFYAGYYRFERS
ncbi:MAG: hypothetical protein JST68_20485 [Bacteroidetes bacterium]|nr:hypothetical protein [Bacteroidota bacterium]